MHRIPFYRSITLQEGKTGCFPKTFFDVVGSATVTYVAVEREEIVMLLCCR